MHKQLAQILTVVFVLTFTGCSSVWQWQKDEPDDTQMEKLSAAEADSVLPEWDDENLTVEQVLERTPQWMQEASDELRAGDSTSAEQQMMRSILALQNVLLEVPPAARPSLVDTLAGWSDSYEQHFGAISGELVATEEGLSALISQADVESAKADPDSLIDELALDTFEVELDTTLTDANALPPIPDTLTTKVENVIEYFTKKPRGRKAMQVWLNRAGEVIPRMRPILREHGMPEDLVYLSMIESGFRHDAHSWAAAVGPWQFIASTGKTFDLEIDWWYDERRDVEKATHAASRFLRQLHEHLGDWYLALAAYNCGEGRVNREIRRSNSRDFWDLNRLPRQTRNYVPTFLAARMIAKNPEKYGFTPPTFVEIPPRDTVYISEAVDMDALADALKINRNEFKEMNPAIRRWCTPPDRKNVEMYLPQGYGEKFEPAVAALPRSKKTSWVRHQVRRGEALSTIARNYGSSMTAIMNVPENGLSSPHRIRAGKTLLIPVGPGSPGSASQTDYSDQSSGDRTTYIVRRGDTLSDIAERHGVGLSRLLRWNRLSKYSTIHPGQRLSLYGVQTSERPKITATSDRKNAEGRPVYIVRRGDSVWEIADRHNVAVSQVLAWNGLSKRSTIRPGDQLIVGEAGSSGTVETADEETYAGPQPAVPTSPVPLVAAPQNGRDWAEYQVRRGDTLWDIARAHDVSVEQLKAINGLNSGSRLMPGQTLQVPPVDAESIIYRVRRGDTLSLIARRFDVSVQDLKAWNNIRNANQIRVGDELVVRTNKEGGRG